MFDLTRCDMPAAVTSVVLDADVLARLTAVAEGSGGVTSGLFTSEECAAILDMAEDYVEDRDLESDNLRLRKLYADIKARNRDLEEENGRLRTKLGKAARPHRSRPVIPPTLMPKFPPRYRPVRHLLGCDCPAEAPPGYDDCTRCGAPCVPFDYPGRRWIDWHRGWLNRPVYLWRRLLSLECYRCHHCGRRLWPFQGVRGRFADNWLHLGRLWRPYCSERCREDWIPF